GDKFVFVASKSKGLITTQPTTPWLVRRDSVSGKWGKAEKLFDKGICTSVAFGNSDKWIVASVDYFKLGALQNLAYLITDQEKLGDLRGYKHTLQILDADNRKVLTIYTSANFGLR